jgi:hypothetical protein
MTKSDSDETGEAPMSLPWRWEAWWFPELLRCRSDDERKQLFDLFNRRRGQFWTWQIVTTGLAIGAASAIGDLTLGRWMRVEWVRIALFMLVAGGVGAGVSLLRLRPLRRYLREQLHARGVAICVRCGYDLTGNVSGRCPECGQPMA